MKLRKIIVKCKEEDPEDLVDKDSLPYVDDYTGEVIER